MISADRKLILCDESKCNNTIKNHAWGKIKAEGWAQLKTGFYYCPKHHPEWYNAWTRKKR